MANAKILTDGAEGAGGGSGRRVTPGGTGGDDGGSAVVGVDGEVAGGGRDAHVGSYKAGSIRGHTYVKDICRAR